MNARVSVKVMLLAGSLLLVLLLAGAAGSSPARAATGADVPALYWSHLDTNHIYRANLDGSAREIALTMEPAWSNRPPIALVIDEAAGELVFWAREPDYGEAHVLWRAGLDGEDLRPAFPNLRTFCSLYDEPRALAIDGRNGDLYWPSDQPCYWAEDAGSFVRGTPAGDVRFRFMPGPRNPYGFPAEQPDLEIDQAAGLVYWTDLDGIRRATFDGVETEPVLFWTSTPYYPYYPIEYSPFALDTEAGLIYFVSAGDAYPQSQPLLVRADLAAPWQQDLLLELDPGEEVMDLAVDTIHDKLYWTQQGAAAAIRRANLDGTAAETIVDQVSAPHGLALDPLNDRMVWADWSARKIQRARLDGSVIEDLVDTAPMRPRFPALNAATGKIYWTGQGDGRVWQAPWDGGAYELLVPGTDARTGGLAYDSAGDTLFWTDSARQAVTVAQGDGGNVRDILYPRVADARALFIEEEAGQLVWYDHPAGAIRRANLDGSGLETVLQGGFSQVTALAWDPLRRQICWADPLARRIECAGWDGQGRRIVLDEADGLRRPNLLAVDARAGQLYWTDWTTHSLHRANLDGSETAVIVDGLLPRPSGLALHLEPLAVRRAHLPLLIGG